MLWYIGRRILQMIPVFLGATLLLYAMVFLLPGDPVTAMFGQQQPNPVIAEQIREQYHLNQPFIVQYLYYLKGIFTLNFGTSFSGVPIITLMANAWPVTAKLAVMALCFEGIFGVFFGLIAGMRKGGVFDATLLIVSMLVISVPTFVIGFVLQLVFCIKLGWFPTTVGTNVSFESLLIPSIVLGAVSFAYVLRLTRTSVSENLAADHVRTATAKGLSRPRVITVHVLRNSLIPVVTFLGTDLGALMGGAIVTEGIFAIPGVGNAIWLAIKKGEGSTIVSFTTVLVVVFIISNLLVDLLYAVLDPRIRYA